MAGRRSVPGLILEAIVDFVGACVLIVAIVIQTPIKSRRAERRYRQIVHDTGLARGRMVDSRLSGDVLCGFSFSIVTLWPGAPDDVLRTVSRGIEAAGYTESPRNREGDPPRRFLFQPPAGSGLRSVHLWIHPYGEPCDRPGLLVPAGETGVVVSM